MQRAFLLAVLLLVMAVAPASAQDGPADATCLGTDIPCWVLWIALANAALLAVVVIRTLVLVARIRRGPDPERMPEVPPDLRDEAPPVPVRSFPAPHAPWPDEVRDGTARRVRSPSSEQVSWGHHRLWFDDGRYFFSDADPEEDWLPCFQVPKGHRIVAGQDGVPRLERSAFPRRRD